MENLTGRTAIPTAINEEEQLHFPASTAIVTDASREGGEAWRREHDDATALSKFNSTATARGHHLPNFQAGGILGGGGVDWTPHLMLTSSSATIGVETVPSHDQINHSEPNGCV